MYVTSLTSLISVISVIYLTSVTSVISVTSLISVISVTFVISVTSVIPVISVISVTFVIHVISVTLSGHFVPPYCILWVFLAKVPKSTDLGEISTFRYILLFYPTGDRILRSFTPYVPALGSPYRTDL